MKSLLLKELENELLRLQVLDAVGEKHAGYLQCRMEELEQVIDYIKKLIQEERNNKQVEILFY